MIHIACNIDERYAQHCAVTLVSVFTNNRGKDITVHIIARELTESSRRRLNELAAAYGATLGLKVNAGHGLTMDNVKPLLDIPNLDTLNIGHSIVAHALFVGMEQAVRDMLAAIRR